MLATEADHKKLEMKHFSAILLVSLLICPPAIAGGEKLASSKPVTLSGYLETYYLHDFNHPDQEERPGFTYSHNAVDQPSINLGLIRVQFGHEHLRGNLALGSGTYMRTNYAAEPRDLQKVFEVNIGMLLADRLWLDVGVMPSHIGFESAIGMDNPTLTRSMMADNSPYFETGAKLTYTSEDGQWTVSGLLLNGWQRIQRPAGNTTPAIGHQITFQPHSKLTLNISSLIGNDQSDRDRRMRYFHNFYAKYQINEAWGVIAALDIGAQQVARGSKSYDVWWTPVLITQYRHSERLSFALRGEYYNDKDQVIVSTNTPEGFRTASYSANADYRVSDYFMVRAEIRGFDSRDDIFPTNNGFSDSSLTATTSAILHF